MASPSQTSDSQYVFYEFHTHTKSLRDHEIGLLTKETKQKKNVKLTQAMMLKQKIVYLMHAMFFSSFAVPSSWPINFPCTIMLLYVRVILYGV